MNKWRFKRLLNEKNNRDGIYTYIHLVHLLEKNFSGSQLTSESSMEHRKKADCKTIKKNLGLILKKTPPGHIKNIIELLLKYPETIEIVKDNIDLFLDKLIEIGN